VRSRDTAAPEPSAEAGHAAVDALTALMILASTLIFSITATYQGLQTSSAGLEARRANELVRYLLETAPTEPGAVSGKTGHLIWERIVSEPEQTFGSGAVCAQRVLIRSERSRRVYSAETLKICAAELAE